MLRSLTLVSPTLKSQKGNALQRIWNVITFKSQTLSVDPGRHQGYIIYSYAKHCLLIVPTMLIALVTTTGIAAVIKRCYSNNKQQYYPQNNVGHCRPYKSSALGGRHACSGHLISGACLEGTKCIHTGESDERR